MEIADSFQKLLDYALDLWDSKLVFGLEEACKVVVHVLEDKESGSPEKITFVGLRQNDFFEFDNIWMINLFEDSDF